MHLTLAATLIALLASTSQVYAHQPEPKISNSSLAKSGLMVIDGTDVIDYSELRINKIHNLSRLIGTYQSELGGATLTLELTKLDGDFYEVTRTYSEPETDPQIKRYSCTQQQLLKDSDTELYIKPLGDGIIVLEKDPETEFISSEHWIHYRSL